MKAFGIDISRHQGQVSFDVIKQRGDVTFIGIRSGNSWGYDDPWFPRNWSEARRICTIRTAYHVLYPAEDAGRQMDRFFRTIGDDPGELPLTIDAELDHGQTKLKITQSIVACANIIQARTGRLPLLYTRAEWLNRCAYPAELAHLDGWLAQYLAMTYPAREHPGPPTLPTGWATWKFHQTGDKTPSAGFGISQIDSKQLDYDRFNGTVEELIMYAGLTMPQPARTLEQRVARLEEQARSRGWPV